ncbi:MAG: beta-ketoacyl-ACP reductase [Oscillospiraceae bacterium]|nr:beta-ketoacyl-ACP reductase [Oscillospiraceae bacterium]
MKKTALVTGAKQGIGAAIAARLEKDGFNVAVNDISGVEFAADVSDYTACEELVKAVKEKFGSIDVLVNNAGITRDGLLVRMSEQQYDDVIRVNQKGVFNLMKLVGALMFKQKSGSIINLSSVAGVHGNAGQFNYSASKAAVIGMTLSAAKEFSPRGITVNAIAPGFVTSPMTDVLTEQQKSAILERIAMKRYGQPEEVAALVSFLASEDSRYITGQVIEISGGLVI